MDTSRYDYRETIIGSLRVTRRAMLKELNAPEPRLDVVTAMGTAALVLKQMKDEMI